tara:strand:- start:15834 stop:16160 length:327 start_codon:yes stop_codon:yes gene_type:complete
MSFIIHQDREKKKIFPQPYRSRHRGRTGTVTVTLTVTPIRTVSDSVPFFRTVSVMVNGPALGTETVSVRFAVTVKVTVAVPVRLRNSPAALKKKNPRSKKESGFENET